MAVYRPKYKDPKTGKAVRSAVWWYEFAFAGRRVRESAKTTRKTVAGEAEKRRRAELERAHAGMPIERPDQRIRTVGAVLKEYRATYPVNHREKSILMVKNRCAHLLRLLGSLVLSDMTAQRVLEYMEQRRSEAAGNRTINLELQILACAMGYTWKGLWPRVKRLEENHDVGRALEPNEEQAILEAAARNQSRLIYPFLFTLAWTGMRSDEARTLRWSQVDLGEAGEIRVGGAKTEAGKGRRIPLTGNLKAALIQHAARYSSQLGSVQPNWYVFPLSNRLALKDPLKPVTSLKTAWESVRTFAKVNCRLHDLRHSFCTKLAEAGVPESTMLDIMGHVSTAMLRRYSHIRAQARRDAIDALESRQLSIGVPKESPKVGDQSADILAVTH
jgi:integrase